MTGEETVEGMEEGRVERATTEVVEIEVEVDGETNDGDVSGAVGVVEEEALSGLTVVMSHEAMREEGRFKGKIDVI